MGILDFLKGVLRLFIDNFQSFIDKLRNKIPADLDKNIDIIIQVVNELKGFVNSPLADVIVHLIPGTIDDKIRAWLIKWLPVVLTNLGYLKNGIITITDQEVERGAQLRSIASALTERFTGMSGDQSAIATVSIYRGERTVEA